MAIETIDEAKLGAVMEQVVGNSQAGHVLGRTEIDAAFRRFKRLADLGAPVTLDDVFQEVRA